MSRFSPNSWQRARIALAAALWIASAGGCVAAEPPLNPVVAAMVGKDAKRVAHGVPPLEWKVPSAGNLAVVDQTLGGVITYCSIRNPGQVLSIDPQEANVVLKNPTDAERFDVLVDQIDPTHEFAVYFTATSAPPSQSNAPLKRPTQK